MLQSNGRAERLLLCGGPGAGKTTAYMKIAEWLDRTESPAKMYVLDPDFKARLDPNAFLPNLHIYDDLGEWQDYKMAVADCKARGNRANGDWLVVDMMARVWSDVQKFYTNMALGKDLDDLFIDWRKSNINDPSKGKGGNPFEAAYGKDWQAINAMYDGFMYNVTRFPGNVLMTSGIQSIGEDEKDVNIIRMFGKWGVRPAGQKTLGHVAADTLLMQSTARGWTYSQLRGTGREEFKNEPLGDFVMDYLVKRANWSL